jgi:hypothetical protein
MDIAARGQGFRGEHGVPRPRLTKARGYMEGMLSVNF